MDDDYDFSPVSTQVVRRLWLANFDLVLESKLLKQFDLI
jgi:hypothetical protein